MPQGISAVRPTNGLYNMRAEGMRAAFNFNPKYRVTMLTTEESTGGPGTPPAVKGLVWYTEGSRTPGGTGTAFYGQSLGRRLSISLGKHATVFQTEI